MFGKSPSVIIYVACIFFHASFAYSPAEAYPFGADYNPTGSPIGGGPGYNQAIDSSESNYIVANACDLLDALEWAQYGEIIYIDDEAEINITDLDFLTISSGVTLASGRGMNGSPGALLYSTNSDDESHAGLDVRGHFARITGIRLRGPHPYYNMQSYHTIPASTTRGICASDCESVEIDNCEIWGWRHASIYLNHCNNAHVHHNYIHHNLYAGLGYGVSLGGQSRVRIEANLFNANRHSVAGTGVPGQGYEVLYNIFDACGYSHAVDMHGGCDRNDGTNIAGDYEIIEYNTFNFDSTCHPAVRIRGEPIYGAWIMHNSFLAENASQAIETCVNCSCTSPYFVIVCNEYDLHANGVCNINYSHQVEGFCLDGTWAQIDNHHHWKIGDFNGDRQDDLMRNEHENGGAIVYLSHSSSFASATYWSREEWGDQSWYIGDFNGDGKDDLLRHTEHSGSEVLLSTGSAFMPPSQWTTESNGGNWQIGDFNGDQLDDLLCGNSSLRILLSNGSAFSPPSSSWTEMEAGRFGWFIGDYNNDGLDDIMHHIGGFEQSGAEVLLSTGSYFEEPSSWCSAQFDPRVSCNSTIGFDAIDTWYLGDFDGDGSEDIFRHLPGSTGAEVFLSNRISEFIYSGGWTQIEASNQGWYTGDFNGDGKTDIGHFNVDQNGFDVLLSCYEPPVAPDCPDSIDEFLKCITGPGQPIPAGCTGDLDQDQDNDMRDYALYQLQLPR